jgi:hypothetical protein
VAVQEEISELLPGAAVTTASSLASEVTGSLAGTARLAGDLGKWPPNPGADRRVRGGQPADDRRGTAIARRAQRAGVMSRGRLSMRQEAAGQPRLSRAVTR